MLCLELVLIQDAGDKAHAARCSRMLSVHTFESALHCLWSFAFYESIVLKAGLAWHAASGGTTAVGRLVRLQC